RESSLPPGTAMAANDAAVGSAAAGTALGALAGAAIGSLSGHLGTGAALGAGAGLVAGSAVGAGRGRGAGGSPPSGCPVMASAWPLRQGGGGPASIRRPINPVLLGQLHSSLSGGSCAQVGMDDVLIPAPPVDTDAPLYTDAPLGADVPSIRRFGPEGTLQ